MTDRELGPDPHRSGSHTTPIRALVVGSTSILDTALAALVAGLPGFELATTADLASGDRPGDQPDVALLFCPDPTDLGALVAHRRDRPTLPILCLAISWSAPQAAGALGAGAAGCLSGGSSVEALAASLRQVARGEIAVSPDVAPGLIAHLARRDTPPAVGSRGTLTAREHEVLALVCEGLGNKEIAQRLYLSLRTVENHLASIYGKLGVGSRTEAAVLAVRQGWATVGNRGGADPPGGAVGAEDLMTALDVTARERRLSDQHRPVDPLRYLGDARLATRRNTSR